MRFFAFQDETGDKRGLQTTLIMNLSQKPAVMLKRLQSGVDSLGN
jgi:hypothetical protein